MRKSLVFSTAGLIIAAAIGLASPVVAADDPPKVNAGTYSSPATEMIVENFVRGATVGTLGCGINAVTGKMKKLKGSPNYLARIAAYSSEVSAKTSGVGSICKSAKQLAAAAAYVAYLGQDGRPVYVAETTTVSTGRISKKTTTTYDIGPDASSTQRFETNVTTGRFF